MRSRLLANDAHSISSSIEARNSEALNTVGIARSNRLQSRAGNVRQKDCGGSLLLKRSSRNTPDFSEDDSAIGSAIDCRQLSKDTPITQKKLPESSVAK